MKMLSKFAALWWLLVIMFSISCSTPSPVTTSRPQVPPISSTGISNTPIPITSPVPTTPVKPVMLPQFPVTITDGLGKKITISRMPEKIISLSPANTEILFALGLSDRIVGVTSYCDFPEEVKSKPKVGGFSTPDLERMVSLKPDLIIAADINKTTGVPAMEKLGLVVVTLAPKTFSDVVENIALVGKVTGKQAEAELLLSKIDVRYKAVLSRTQTISGEKRLRVLYVVWHDPVWTTGSGTFSNDLIEKAGGINIFARDFSDFRMVSLEETVSRDPQVILASGMARTGAVVLNAIKSEERMRLVSAIVNNRVHEIDGNIIERPGPRLIDGLEQVAKQLYPMLFN